jgi:O-antigen/teichoic acid export membrane protein
MWLLPQALSDVLFPRVAALSARADQDQRAVLAMTEAKGLRHAVIATFAVAIVLASALLFMVVPIYGAPFRQSTMLGLILLPGAALLGIANPLAAAVVGRGRPGLLFKQAVIVTPLTALAYFGLIPALGATGAALASSLSYCVSFVVTALLYGRVTATNPLRQMIPTRSELADYRALVSAVRGRLTAAIDRSPRRAPLVDRPARR